MLLFPFAPLTLSPGGLGSHSSFISRRLSLLRTVCCYLAAGGRAFPQAESSFALPKASSAGKLGWSLQPGKIGSICKKVFFFFCSHYCCCCHRRCGRHREEPCWGNRLCDTPFRALAVFLHLSHSQSIKTHCSRVACSLNQSHSSWAAIMEVQLRAASPRRDEGK